MLPGVLFVDDEEWVLEALRRSLRHMQHKWAVRFASGGAEALSLLEEFPCDVIVTDMQMPGMTGAELLDTVEETYPEIVRIVLSGNYDQSSMFRLVRGEHQYLAKPCGPDLLVSTVNASLKMREIGNGMVRQNQVDGLVVALENLGKILFSKGIADRVEVPSDVQHQITDSGLEAIRPIIACDYDPELEDAFDALLDFPDEEE